MTVLTLGGLGDAEFELKVASFRVVAGGSNRKGIVELAVEMGATG